MAALNIDRALVLHIAKLASLSLSEGEADRFALELAVIVGYVAQLDELDTSNVPPTANLALDRAPWRGDDPKSGLSHADALAQAPFVEQGGFAVPIFVE